MVVDTSDAKEVELPEPFNKPWFRKAYRAAVEFHEKDEVLNKEDRLVLSNAYRNIARSQAYGGWLGFSAVFCSPFAWQFYKTKSIKGVNVGRSFLLGMFALFGATHLSGMRAYKNQLKKLDPNGSLSHKNTYGDDDFFTDQAKPRAQRQYEMMALLKNGASTKWASYFYLTSEHPERKFPDPRLKIQQLKELRGDNFQVSPFMHQRDPLGLYKDRVSGKGKEEDKDQVQNYSGSNPGPSDSWNKVRQDNGTESSWDKVRNPPAWSGEQQSGNEGIEGFGDLPTLAGDDHDGLPIERPTQSEFEELLGNERRS
ncbi:hypothetical protein KAFR_0B01240 [Kazachstania africana CBS 2517]|uniref:Uncharacterized protein n=1 Tax=Kazachstania africana (strain ATCC 22294 / BCRC 22015 / CBS 2517 / CECT 1963 / NBRC 1671 / NRRL Y-8276) TaxID=1071382 RepID=H2APX3_KAZAF|nr:hypothetical protein KAFR_0B01240 [Kazachstania africana CBS 2517]CCF56423.1 hypothetical protein KAFR_0B01240 [Kazachstania africana CBS 2517]